MSGTAVGIWCRMWSGASGARRRADGQPQLRRVLLLAERLVSQVHLIEQPVVAAFIVEAATGRIHAASFLQLENHSTFSLRAHSMPRHVVYPS